MPKNLKLENLNQAVSFAALEEKVLDYWDQTKAFEESVNQRPQDKPYVFYDGPPFATGLPHYGHILASTIKDVFPRYWTMKGHRVERVWGWDCHGIPIENIIEQELNLKGGKKGIEEYGIDKFNAACRSAILRFDQEWEKVIHRIGRWVDFKNSYKTMDTSYMESVWWAFKTLYEKDLVYQGRKVILYCPRCSTPLSNFEIAMDNSYADVTEASTVYKYKLRDQKDTYLLAWSTTPWNKLATPALAVSPILTYVKVKQSGEFYILAENTTQILNDEPYEVVEKFSGKELQSFKFELHFDFYPQREGKQAGVIVAEDFVTDEEGTGAVTLAVYGEDDWRVMHKHNIQLVEHVDDEGNLKPEVKPWVGMDILKVNPLVNQDLAGRGLIYKDEQVTHSVAHCYRCNTRLYYAPIPAWFIDITKLKSRLTKTNEDINWYPGHLKHGRFGKGLQTAPDWNISRSRYWGTPMPIWVGDKSDKLRVIGSIQELQQWAVNPDEVKDIQDIHRESIDHIKLWVDDDRKEQGSRIKEVFDCWVESGSMPYASEHYPFKNKQKFESRHPAQFIAEYIAQTRAWFYTLHVMSVGLFDTHTFENAVTTGTIMAEDGSKMSKSKKNFPDPNKLINQYGVDSLRLYLMSSSVMKAGNINFSEKQVDEIRKKVFNIFFNVFKFYALYDDNKDSYNWPDKVDHILDKWLISLTEKLTQEVLTSMDNYDVVSASRSLMAYVDQISTWWLRRSRDRLKQTSANGHVLQIFRTAIFRWITLLAPISPFLPEVIYQNLPGKKLTSIHLEMVPTANPDLIDTELENQMKLLRLAAEKSHAQRKAHSIKVRQPLNSVKVHAPGGVGDQLKNLLAEEINVKHVDWIAQEKPKEVDKTTLDLTVQLDTNLTPELKAEGQAREIIRDIQKLRKKEGTGLDEWIEVTLPDWPQEHEAEIKQKVLAKSLKRGDHLTIKRLQT